MFSNLASLSHLSLTSSRSELEFGGGSEVAAAISGKHCRTALVSTLAFLCHNEQHQ